MAGDADRLHADGLIDAENVAVGHARRPILERVTLRVGAGEFWFLLGRNGAGKSTLLRAIVGTLPPLGGRLRLHPALASRERLGFVPQRCDVNPALPTTVREFVLLGTVGLSLRRADEAERLAWALDHAGLGGMATRDFRALSGGERQRALVARALVRQPTLLILDEPTSNLDPGAEEALLALLAQLNSTEGLTLLVVTHDLALAAHHATHVALAADGTITTGPRDAVLTPAALTRAFGIDVGWAVDVARGRS